MAKTKDDMEAELNTQIQEHYERQASELLAYQKSLASWCDLVNEKVVATLQCIQWTLQVNEKKTQIQNLETSMEDVQRHFRHVDQAFDLVRQKAKELLNRVKHVSLTDAIREKFAE